jgi:hypothetical protein
MDNDTIDMAGLRNKKDVLIDAIVIIPEKRGGTNHSRQSILKTFVNQVQEVLCILGFITDIKKVKR